jgi:hypothetical protein
MRKQIGAERRLRELGIHLPVAPTPFGPYVPLVERRQPTVPQRDASYGKVSEPEAYRSDLTNAAVQILEAGHFALDTAAD